MEDYIVIYAIVPKHIYETKELTPEDKLIFWLIVMMKNYTVEQESFMINMLMIRWI